MKRHNFSTFSFGLGVLLIAAAAAAAFSSDPWWLDRQGILDWAWPVFLLVLGAAMLTGPLNALRRRRAPRPDDSGEAAEEASEPPS